MVGSKQSWALFAPSGYKVQMDGLPCELEYLCILLFRFYIYSESDCRISCLCIWCFWTDVGSNPFGAKFGFPADIFPVVGEDWTITSTYQTNRLFLPKNELGKKKKKKHFLVMRNTDLDLWRELERVRARVIFLMFGLGSHTMSQSRASPGWTFF